MAGTDWTACWSTEAKGSSASPGGVLEVANEEGVTLGKGVTLDKWLRVEIQLEIDQLKRCSEP